MHKGLLASMAFVVGGVAGFIAGKLYYEDKYRKITEEEILSLRAYSKKKSEEVAQAKTEVIAIDCSPDTYAASTYTVAVYEEKKAAAEANAGKLTSISPREKPDLSKYAKITKKLGYSDDAPKEKKAKDDLKPAVVPPDEFGTEEGFDIVGLTYYADGTLADEADDPMPKEDIERLVGSSALKTFGEYERDTVYVRNRREKIYYEITRDTRTYFDVVGEPPHILEE